jgi:anti-sigma B factor antagonist
MATPSSASDGPLTVQLEQDGESLTVRASGELDIATTEALQEALRHAFDGDAEVIILDVAEVTFIDSMGLRALLWAAEHQDGHRLGVRCGPGAVRRMIEMTGMDASLPLIK